MEAVMLACPERNGAGGVESVAAVPQAQEVKTAEPEMQEAEAAEPNPSTGARAAGSRISDPENGKTCHQCRQKRSEFAVSCKMRKNYGLCSIKYCHKCLLNRYGENDAEESQKEAWTCPKCRGVCNCSMCRKKKGEAPTGILAHAAKASGCSSVHELLNMGTEVVASAQKLRSTPKGNPKRAVGSDDVAPDELSAKGDYLNAVPSVPLNKRLKGNCTVNNSPAEETPLDENNGEPLLRDESPDAPDSSVVPPMGTPVTNIAGAELETEDVGPAIQFIEFCRSFAEIFEIKKGQPERILQDITGGRELRVVPSLIFELHINLLSVLQEDRGQKPVNYSRDRDNWITDIGKYISELKFISKELPLDFLNEGFCGYKKLSPSCKLHVLNFLCDETLSSAKLRNWIGKKNESAAERNIAVREKICTANTKEKDMAKAMLSREGGETCSTEETGNLVSQIKESEEVKQATRNEKKQGGVLRIEPFMVDRGVAYWKLDGYCNNTAIMRQEFNNEDVMRCKDMWFMFTEDEEKVLTLMEKSYSHTDLNLLVFQLVEGGCIMLPETWERLQRP